MARPDSGWRGRLLGGRDSWRRILVTGAVAGVTLAFVGALIAALVTGGGSLDGAKTPTPAGGAIETVPPAVETLMPTDTPAAEPTEPLATPTEPPLAPTETLPPAEPTATPALEEPSPTLPAGP